MTTKLVDNKYLPLLASPFDFDVLASPLFSEDFEA